MKVYLLSNCKGTWVGLELISSMGSHSGVVKGKRYFKCREKRGMVLAMPPSHSRTALVSRLAQFHFINAYLVCTSGVMLKLDKIVNPKAAKKQKVSPPRAILIQQYY